MKFALPQFTFRRFLGLLLGCFLLAFPLYTVLIGPNYLFNGTTCLIVIYLLLFLILALKAADGYLFNQVAMMTIFFLIYFFPRLLMYLVRPDLVIFPFGEGIGFREVNHGLTCVLIGSFFIMIGFILAEYFWRRKFIFQDVRSKEDVPHFRIGVLLIIFFIVILIDWYIQYGLGVNMFFSLRAKKYNILIQALHIITNIDMVFFIFFATVVPKIKKGNIAFWMTFLAVNFYILVLALYGSRITGIRVMLMLAVIMLSLKNNFKTYLSRYVGIIAYLMIITLILYPLTTQLRINLAPGYYFSLGSDSFKKRLLVGFISRDTRDGVQLYNRLGDFIASAMRNFAVVDFAVLVLTQKPNPTARKNFMNIAYVAKSTANALLPGDIFPEATLNTSRLVTVLFRGFSEEYVKTHGYFSEYYSPWGIFFLIFGLWKSLFMLLISGFLINFAYWAIQLFCRRYRYYLGALFLLTFSYLFYANMGIDHWLSNSIILFVSATSALLLFYVFSSLVERFFPSRK
jgi:hypothetical protein